MSEHAESTVDMSSQRQDQRIAVYASGRLCFEDGTVHECELMNVSAGGAMIKAAVDCSGQDEIVLDLPGVGRFPARPAWRHNDFLGLAFLDRIEDIEEIVRSVSQAEEATDEKRRHKRISVLWRARLYAAGKTHEVRLLNISPGGAKLRGPALPKNAVVILTVGRAGEVPGRVAWCDHDQMGIRFLDQPKEVCELFREILPSMRI